jgi:hypothetical protein
MSKTMLEVYEGTTVPFEKSSYVCSDGNVWTAPHMYKAIKERKIRVERMNLRHIDLCRMPWSGGAISSIDIFLDHMIRVKNSSLDHPIVMCWDGFVMDGWHRIVKAIMDGRTHINAYRFEKYLEPDQPKGD